MRLFAFLFYGFIAVVSIYWVSGSLVGDYRVASEGFQPAADWRVTKATCDTDYVIVSLCQLRFEHATSAVKDDATYVLMGSQRVPGAVAVVTGVRSGIPSTSFGQERLLNRTVTFTVYAGLLFWLVYVQTRFGSHQAAGVTLAAWLRARTPAKPRQQAPGGGQGVASPRSASRSARAVRSEPAVVRQKRLGWFS